MEIAEYLRGLVNSHSIFFSLLTFILSTAYVRYRWKRKDLEALGKLLPGPKVWPIVGSALDFITQDVQECSKMMIHWSKSYPSPSRFWFGPFLCVCVYDAENMEIVLKSNKAFEKDRVYKLVRDYIGEGLIAAPEEKWRQSRRLLGPAFNNRLLASFIRIFNRKNRRLIKRLQGELGKGVFNAYDYISSISLEAVCEAALGVDFDFTSSSKEFLEAFNLMTHFIFVRGTSLWYYWTPLWNILGPKEDIKRVDAALEKFIDTIIAEAKVKFHEKKTSEELDEDMIFRKSFIEILLELCENGAHYTDKDLRDEVITLLFAATDTSSTAESYFLLMMAMHPEVQQKVYDEVIQVVGDREITADDCSRLEYLEKAIKETLRLFPPVPVIFRTNKETLKLSNCTVPPGVTLTLGIFGLHRDPSLYPDPEKYDPERFSPENIANRHPFSFVPFSGGLRGCMGMKYAYLIMKVTVANIVRAYKISSPWKMKDIQFRGETMLKTVGGFPISIENRQL